ncbi:MAG: hypothetical protein AAFV53_18490 [Myxococcota bacterium]
MSIRPPKAQSVTKQGADDGFVPPLAYLPQVLDGGYTRLLVSAPSGQLQAVHTALIGALKGPLKFRYVKLTDRQRGQLPQPESYAAVELLPERVISALQANAELCYHDGRNQLWIQGALGEMVVLEEIGVVYVYPDDILFREVLEGLGLVDARHESMAERDYVKVNFAASADAQEQALFQSLGLVRWEG